MTQRLRGKIVNAAHEKPRNFGLGCAVYLGLFLGYMFVLNPLLLTMVERNGAAHGFWSFVIVIGGAVAVIAWTSARTNAQTALKMKELEDRRLQEADRRLREAAELEIQMAEARPQIHAFEQSLLQKFDCRPCPRCAELEMNLHGMSPNGRSLAVRCSHCDNEFRWKAVHPDTTDVSSAYRCLNDTVWKYLYWPTVSVPPNKFSAEGGREPIPQGVRQVVWRRDGGCCVQCGAEVNLHFDHIIPVAKGGATTVENLQILCASCNLSKGARIETLLVGG